SGDPYAAAISRNCGVWIPGLAHARPGRQRHHSAVSAKWPHANTSSPSPPARGQAPAGIRTPQQYRETAEYGSRASLTLARAERHSTRRPRPGRREDRLQRGPRAYLLAAVVTMDSRLRGNERSMVHALVCPRRLMPSLRKRRTCCGKVNLGNGVTAVTSET